MACCQACIRPGLPYWPRPKQDELLEGDRIVRVFELRTRACAAVLTHPIIHATFSAGMGLDHMCEVQQPAEQA